jgi:hypothetical protein
MHDMVLNSGRDALLFAVPSLSLLVISLFRLDSVFTGPRKAAKPLRPGASLNEEGEEMLCDPDGRTWSKGRSRK